MGKAKGIWAARNLLKRHTKKYRSMKRFRQRQRNMYKDTSIHMSKAAHAKGIVLQRAGYFASIPNHGTHKCAVVQLARSGKKVVAYCPGDGALNYVEENDRVLISYNRKKRTKCCVFSIRFKIIKVNGVCLQSILLGKRDKPML